MVKINQDASLIHSTAIVHPKAKLADGVSVGPYAIIGENVSVGRNTAIGAHCVVDGWTAIGENCRIFTAACIGSIPQDLKYKGERTELIIGDNNIIREYVTINLGTAESGKTVIGSDNLIMAYAHIAHDCRVGNKVIIANAGTLAGHVTIEDKVVIGGLSGVHQFVRVGTLSIVGGCSKGVKDIPPYSTCDGHPARVFGINSVGLSIQGTGEDIKRNLKTAFKILFHSELSIPHALERIEKEIAVSGEIRHLIDFVRASERGITI